MTHTPGPWTMQDEQQTGVRNGRRIMGANKAEVIFAGVDPPLITLDDAYLIAAAPELLEALRHAANDLESRIYLLPVDADSTDRAILEAQRNIYGAAIAKAEGRA